MYPGAPEGALRTAAIKGRYEKYLPIRSANALTSERATKPDH